MDPQPETLAVVYWQTLSGISGHGEPIPRHLAQIVVNSFNLDAPGRTAWLQEVQNAPHPA